MALPTDGQNANELDEVTEVPAGKELIFFDPTTNAGGIITLENLTKQILNGINSQAFNLDAGQMTILQALNSLNGKTSNQIFSASIAKNKTYTFNLNIAATLFFIRTNKPSIYTGTIYIDIFGSVGTVEGINVKVENNKVSIINTDDTVRFCVGIVK